MSSVNKVILLGRLGRDPEAKTFQNGGMVVNFSVATGESWKDKNTGEKKEKTDWHNVAIFSEGLAKVAERYLRKGSQVYLEGKLQTRKWQDQSGNDRYSTEVVLQGFDAKLVLIGGNGNGSGGSSGSGDGFNDGWSGDSGGASNSFSGRGSVGASDMDLDDDVPF